LRFVNRISSAIAALVVLVGCSAGDDVAEPRFTALDVDTTRDGRTGIVWMSHDAGHGLSWPDAKLHCQGHPPLPNGAQWRLPTIDELGSLYDPSVGQPCGETANCGIDPAIRLSSPYLWSATAPQPDRRVYYDFSFGTQLAPLLRPALHRGVLCTSGSEGDGE
jgi:Protein of unknown function (DUF1566)